MSDDQTRQEAREELTLSELLILASMWMLFGFMLWFYLSAFHGAPARLAAEAILQHVLGSDFSRIIVEPNQNFLYQVETNIPFTFRDGTNVSWLRKFVIMLIGYTVITGVQIWGVVWQSLKMLAFNFGAQTHAVVTSHGVSDASIALGYQLGTLIFPALAPIFVWVLSNRPLVEHFVGWSADQLRKE
jgi:hypothetical protein